jgi:hypothetical protein
MSKTDKLESMEDIWNIGEDIVSKNQDIKREIISDIPDSDKITKDIQGLVINNIGNVVASFGFFAEDAEAGKTRIKISVDGFLSKLYNEDTMILLGYGHPLGFTGLIDPKKAQTIVIGPDVAKGDDIFIVVDNDDTLEKQGLLVIIRDVDVEIGLLNADIKEDFEQSLIDASEEIPDMNELERSHNEYMKKIYSLLETVIKVEEEEYYE